MTLFGELLFAKFIQDVELFRKWFIGRVTNGG